MLFNLLFFLVITCDLLQDLDLLCDLRMLIRLIRSLIGLLLSPFTTAFLPILDPLIYFLGLGQFFSLVFGVVKSMEGFTFGEIGVADLTVSQRT
jgi:hypothetical protein